MNRLKANNWLFPWEPTFSRFFLKKTCFFFVLNHHCGAVALAINFIFWSGNRHSKKHKFLFDQSRDSFFFWWNWTSFPFWRVSKFRIINRFTKNVNKTLYAFGQPKAWGCYSFLWIYRISKMFKPCRILWVLFCLKNSFDFCSCSKHLQLKFDKKNFAQKRI